MPGISGLCVSLLVCVCGLSIVCGLYLILIYDPAAKADFYAAAARNAQIRGDSARAGHFYFHALTLDPLNADLWNEIALSDDLQPVKK